MSTSHIANNIRAGLREHSVEVSLSDTELEKLYFNKYYFVDYSSDAERMEDMAEELSEKG